jgi:ribosomal subunit interface protein
MIITITGKQMEIGDSLKEFINKEIETVITRYMEDAHEVTITMVKDAHHQFKTEVTLHVGKSFLVHCSGSDSDPYKSVSSALTKLESQIRRYKTRLRDKKRHAANHEHRAEIVQKFVIKPQEEDTHDDNPLIIAEMTSEIHTLSVGDAVMRMDLSAAPVVVFRNAANGEMNVVFRRNDGHVGWIDPSQKLA